MDSDDQNPEAAVATGMEWATRIITVALEMVLPGLLGYWLDQKLGTKILLTLVGFGIGMPWALWHLLRMTSGKRKPREK